MAQQPLCFVLMPFGEKPAGHGATINFDRIYAELIRPAIEAAELEPIRADEEQAGGVIHKPMFERLLLCEYAVADLTTANANVFYELGVRHAVKERSTVLIFAEGIERLPFDVGLLRGLPYRLGQDGGPADPETNCQALTRRLVEARGPDQDSPLWQLVDDYPEIAHEKTDVFRRQVEYAAEVKRWLAGARKDGTVAVRAVERDIGRFADAEAGVLIDLMLSYRATKAWEEVVRVAAAMPPPLAKTAMVLEQRAMALNRTGQGEEAAEILQRLIAERGPSSETYGILGRVLKDRWKAAGEGPLARGLLLKAIDAYRRGFEADWRDAYPGVNAVTLMELAEPPLKEEQARLLPVVRYAIERRIAAGQPDYWDHATLLELAVLEADRSAAENALADALAAIREPFEPETTALNLSLLQEARQRRGTEAAWIVEIEQALRATTRPWSK